MPTDTRTLASLAITFWLVWFALKLRAAGRAWWLSPFFPAVLFMLGMLVVIWIA